ncbi:TRAP transporter substrate-binding protein DctP [Pararhodobacter oceanensis]|uniref:C4-dicarboxylate ABC transporter substrate-binding protein n=1 Tax=Pararhodobacter oceanensis TaxID=2172121 RepID=A0A2T8HZK3_9RHOB|nr:TRAP transporter substrate-binding protein DctP [Pararhodobacter oceanensis]PVH30857.1 C4-dicarboxylate ABC transporter substrate-binding protein [Pararhodobacter oceanensis]
MTTWILKGAAVLALLASQAAAQTTLRVATDSGPEGSPSGNAIARWAEMIEEGSDGDLEVRVFYQNQLGGQLEVFDLFVAGEVDLMLSWPSTSYDRRIGVLNAPYMVTSWEEALAAYQPGGWVNATLNDVFADLGITYFGAWPEGFAGVATRDRYALDIASAEGLNVRTPPFFPIPQTLQAMGYQTAAIDWSEVFTSIQTGVVDGDAGNVIYWDYEYFGEILDYYVRTKHIFVTGNLVANTGTMESLSDEHQALIRDAAVTIMEAQFVEARAEDERNVQIAIEGGMEYFEPSIEELRPMIEAVRAEVWPLMEADIGSEIVGQMRANAN